MTPRAGKQAPIPEFCLTNVICWPLNFVTFSHFLPIKLEQFSLDLQLHHFLKFKGKDV